MTKKINSIQFLGDKVVIDYAEGQAFQFCKRCKNGNHFRFFLHHFCPQLLKHFDNSATAAYFERRFYFLIHQTATRQLVMQETLNFLTICNGASVMRKWRASGNRPRKSS